MGTYIVNDAEGDVTNVGTQYVKRFEYPLNGGPRESRLTVDARETLG